MVIIVSPYNPKAYALNLFHTLVLFFKFKPHFSLISSYSQLKVVVSENSVTRKKQKAFAVLVRLIGSNNTEGNPSLCQRFGKKRGCLKGRHLLLRCPCGRSQEDDEEDVQEGLQEQVKVIGVDAGAAMASKLGLQSPGHSLGPSEK